MQQPRESRSKLKSGSSSTARPTRSGSLRLSTRSWRWHVLLKSHDGVTEAAGHRLMASEKREANHRRNFVVGECTMGFATHQRRHKILARRTLKLSPRTA